MHAARRETRSAWSSLKRVRSVSWLKQQLKTEEACVPKKEGGKRKETIVRAQEKKAECARVTTRKVEKKSKLRCRGDPSPPSSPSGPNGKGREGAEARDLS